MKRHLYFNTALMMILSVTLNAFGQDSAGTDIKEPSEALKEEKNLKESLPSLPSPFKEAEKKALADSISLSIPDSVSAAMGPQMPRPDKKALPFDEMGKGLQHRHGLKFIDEDGDGINDLLIPGRGQGHSPIHWQPLDKGMRGRPGPHKPTPFDREGSDQEPGKNGPGSGGPGQGHNQGRNGNN
ncbi:hypothetical protein GF406_05840 [candidate division KSB1 bacterium]|jgi:hypothetical protein|nr:hypothetical protein [candidate division KSB1 bacterium]